MDMEESSARKHHYEIREEGGAPCPSGVSMKSTNSMNPPNYFRTGAVNPGEIKAYEIMNMKHNSPAKERRCDRREKTTNSLDPLSNNRTGAVNPEDTLSGCNLTDQCCESVATALKLNSSLRELDLSNNDLKDSGGKLLFDALKSQTCQLEILRLSICNFTDECCESLASALQSSDSCLKELDLSNNDLKDSGVKLIADALKSPNCKLEKLRLSGCMVTKEGCSHLASALSLTSSHLRELDLSYNYPGDSKLSQENPKCKLCLDHGGENMIKPGLQKYFCDLTLDPNTVHNRLSLSESNKKLLYNSKPMSHPEHPERFDSFPRVLCKERLSGRCYWEAEWSGEGDMVVSYEGIGRKGEGNDVRFGANDKSWILSCFVQKLIAWHKDGTPIPPPSPPSNKFGVYLDEPAGILSFYSISDTNTLRHLHTFNTTFTEPLCAGFVLYNSSVSLCDVKKQGE